MKDTKKRKGSLTTNLTEKAEIVSCGQISSPMTGYTFCSLVVDLIVAAGGQLSTAYKCASLYAEDIERRNLA